MKPKCLSWKPVRRGNIYCSSACGGGCTFQQHARANALAAKYAALLGKGWKSVVHENLGWYATIVSPCGRIKIAIHTYLVGSPSFTAFLGERGEACGGRWAESGGTAKSAARLVMATAKAELAKIGAMIEGLPKL